MKHPLLIPLFLLIAATSTAQMPVEDCDGFRRKVSTLTDADTLFLGNHERTTLTWLTQLPFVAPSDTTPRLETERHVYRLNAWLRAFKRLQNGDIYLVLQDEGSESDSIMVAIIPNPECSDVRESSQWQFFRNTYDDFVGWYGLPDTTLKPSQIFRHPFGIEGVPFHNLTRNDTVQAANNVELHPVLKLTPMYDTAVDEGSSLPLKMNLSQNGD